MDMTNKQLSAEGPSFDELRIIGIELAAERPDGREVELEMVGVTHTIPNERWHQHRARVTIHTSNGDVTVRFPLKPGAYYAG